MMRLIQKLIRMRRPLTVFKFIVLVAIYMLLIYCKRLRELTIRAPDFAETPNMNKERGGESTEFLKTDFGLRHSIEVLDKMLNGVSTTPQIFKASSAHSPFKIGINAPGELGKPVHLPTNMPEDMRKAVDEGWQHNKFNQYVSDMISVQRTLPDLRHEWCKQPDRYLRHLPKTDVIICFHNEAWSTMLRTVHSVLNRSPEVLIKNIILVDDCSDMAHLKEPLDTYFKSYKKVRIIRAPKRQGLIRARLFGARYATAPVLTFLDSHCECGVGWLEPLLDPIARNYTTVVYPNIATIDHETFEYTNVDDTLIGGFDWDLTFTWIPTPKREYVRRNHTMEPVHSPTMPGGLFAISRVFFEHLGTYDTGLLIWGAENLELSFKTWMCGGRLEMIPCSYVGHIFRQTAPYNVADNKSRNSVRLAEVWLDNYAKYFYYNINFDKGDYGSVDSQIALRKRLNCESFKWYVQNIYPELDIPKDPVSAGEIRNLSAGGNQCLDVNGRAMSGLPVGLWPCHGKEGNQHWFMTYAGEIRHGDYCLDYGGNFVIIFHCHGKKGDQHWTYDTVNRFLRHAISKLCLAVSTNGENLLLDICDPEDMHQKWLLEKFDEPIILDSSSLTWIVFEFIPACLNNFTI